MRRQDRRSSHARNDQTITGSTDEERRLGLIKEKQQQEAKRRHGEVPREAARSLRMRVVQKRKKPLESDFFNSGAGGRTRTDTPIKRRILNPPRAKSKPRLPRAFALESCTYIIAPSTLRALRRHRTRRKRGETRRERGENIEATRPNAAARVQQRRPMHRA